MKYSVKFYVLLLCSPKYRHGELGDKINRPNLRPSSRCHLAKIFLLFESFGLEGQSVKWIDYGPNLISTSNPHEEAGPNSHTI